jgi:tripartite-type tricarboxylate transporter receptor subunit TctC
MKLQRRQFLHLAAGAAALPAASRNARAQTYPTRPITIVVGYAAGGPTDTAARILAERMKPLLGQAVLVENVTGANGSIGVGRVVRAAPDGYTLSFGDLGTHVVNQVTYPLAYDLRTDLQPIALLATLSALVVARNGMPGGNLTELVAWLRANPNKASAGTGGVAGADHLAGLMFQNVTGTRVQFIRYRGSAPAVQDILAGQIDMMFTFPAVTLPYIQAGRIKAYAAMAKGRLERPACLARTFRLGFPCGRRRARLRTSSHGSTPPSPLPWRARPLRRVLPTWVLRLRRLISNRRTGSPPCRRPRSRNGGRSSRQPESKLNDQSAGWTPA